MIKPWSIHTEYFTLSLYFIHVLSIDNWDTFFPPVQRYQLIQIQESIRLKHFCKKRQIYWDFWPIVQNAWNYCRISHEKSQAGSTLLQDNLEAFGYRLSSLQLGSIQLRIVWPATRLLFLFCYLNIWWQRKQRKIWKLLNLSQK